MTRKLLLFVAAVALLGIAAVACAQSPVIVYIVVTATPEGTPGAQALPSPTPTIEAAEPTTAPTSTAETTTGTATDEPPTTVRQIYVAEQPFQRGRMFWLEPIDQVWVMVETEPGVGIWETYEDLFEEGEPELDESLIAPTGLFQPVRGFGLIWRTGDDLRTNMGWATDLEVGFVTNYEYVPGEGATADTVVPGYHFLQNQYGEWYRFNEINGTWQQVEREVTQPTPTSNAPGS